MKRPALLAMAAALALVTPSAQAAPARTVPPQIVDPKGDAAIGALDILTGVISSPGGRHGEKLLVRLTLAEAPGTLPAEYWVGFWVDCQAYDVRLSWNGAAPGTAASVSHTYCAVPYGAVPQTTPVPYRIEGTSIRFELPLERAVKLGNTANYINASAMPGSSQQSNSVAVAPYAPGLGDWAPSHLSYVIGSERTPARRHTARPGRARPVRPQVVDDKGDNEVAALDIVAVSLSSPGGRYGEKLVIRLTLAEAPGAIPATYTVRFSANCAGHQVRLNWSGSAGSSTAETGERDCYRGVGVIREFRPAEYRIEGKTIVLDLPLGDDLTVGAELRYVGADTCPKTCTQLGTTGEPGEDSAHSDIPYVIGSERTWRTR